jgi:hypothetical protein
MAQTDVVLKLPKPSRDGKVIVELPLAKETPGALQYAFPDREGPSPLTNVYLRKDKLRAAGHVGAWPASVTVTVEY